MTPADDPSMRPTRRTLLRLAGAAAAVPLLSPRAPAALATEDAPEPAAAAPSPIWLVLLRHAEADPEGGADPGLSVAGRARAERLAALFSGAGPSLLLASDRRRARETLEPLAARTGLEVRTLPGADVQAFLTRLRELAAAADGALAVVAGHSNTVPALASALGFPLEGLDAKGNLPEREHARAFVLLPFASPPAALELRIGDA